MVELLSRWLDVRPDEVRKVLLSFGGAFFLIAFLILARSLREALYLTSFDVTTLPYITVTVAILGLPAVGYFSRLLAQQSSQLVLRYLVIILTLGILAIWPFIDFNRGVVVLFYLWTTIGTMLFTAGFWVVTSEHFVLRGAKRLFALISAGGTLGALVMGTSLRWLTGFFEVGALIGGLVVILVLFLATSLFMPKPQEETVKEKKEKTPLGEGLKLVWKTSHLRLIALVVMTATMATTLLDYQFKELVRAELTTKQQLTSFFGAFYGWTGGISLFVQLFVASRLMAVAGIGISLAVLPLILLMGSTSILIVPGIIAATLARGADNSLRKSLYRAVIEVLYIPVPMQLRKKTKAFIDSVLDSVAEGIGAAIIFFWVTLNNFPSRFLSVFIIGLSGFFFYLCRRMHKQYFSTLVHRLEEGKEKAEQLLIDSKFEGKDLLSATLSHMQLRSQLVEMGALPKESEGVEKEKPVSEKPRTTLEKISSSDPVTVYKALEECDDWGKEHLPVLTRLLAQRSFYDQVVKVLGRLGPKATPYLVECLKDEKSEFVIRRRIPRVFTQLGEGEADDALLDVLNAKRFEVRYRSAIALVQRRRKNLSLSSKDWKEIVWKAVRMEVNANRPVWEMRKLLDQADTEKDDLVEKRVGLRGEVSLEHTFRLLSLVLDPEPLRMAYNGIILNDEKLKSFALEYLEHVLPQDIREKLWLFIGDVSEYQKKKALRPVDEVVSDLLKTGATLFADTKAQAALKKIIDSKD